MFDIVHLLYAHEQGQTLSVLNLLKEHKSATQQKPNSYSLLGQKKSWYSRLTIHHSHGYYSTRKLFTGLCVAMRQVCQVMVIPPINNIAKKPVSKVPAPIVI